MEIVWNITSLQVNSGKCNNIVDKKVGMNLAFGVPLKIQDIEFHWANLPFNTEVTQLK